MPKSVYRAHCRRTPDVPDVHTYLFAITLPAHSISIEMYSGGIVQFPVTARFLYNSWFTAEAYLEGIVSGLTPSTDPNL